MYLPIMPTIQKAFGVSTVLTTTTFSMVLFVMAFGTLIYGSVSERLGRRPALLGGLVLFVGGSFVCAVAESFTMLMVGRFLQALAAGCGVVLARAIARDVYGPDRLAQVIAYITAAYVLGPTFAPVVGGFLSDLFGWNAVFVFAVVMSVLVVVLAATVIGETHHRRRATSRRFSSVIHDYARLVRNRVFICYALNPALTSGAFFAMASYASYLMADHYRGTAGEYSLYFVLLTVGFMGGNFVSGRIGNRMRTETMVFAGSMFGLLTVALLAAGVLLLPDEPLALFLPGAVIGIAQGLSMPFAQAAAINAEPDLTGTASGFVMFLHFLIAAIASLFISTLYDGTFYPLLVVLFALIATSLTFGVLANRASRRRAAS